MQQLFLTIDQRRRSAADFLGLNAIRWLSQPLLCVRTHTNQHPWKGPLAVKWKRVAQVGQGAQVDHISNEETLEGLHLGEQMATVRLANSAKLAQSIRQYPHSEIYTLSLHSPSSSLQVIKHKKHRLKHVKFCRGVRTFQEMRKLLKTLFI